MVRTTGVPRSEETAPPPRIAIGPYAYAYCMVLGGGVFYERGTPVLANQGMGGRVEGDFDGRAHRVLQRPTNNLLLDARSSAPPLFTTSFLL